MSKYLLSSLLSTSVLATTMLALSATFSAPAQAAGYNTDNCTPGALSVSQSGGSYQVTLAAGGVCVAPEAYGNDEVRFSNDFEFDPSQVQTKSVLFLGNIPHSEYSYTDNEYLTYNQLGPLVKRSGSKYVAIPQTPMVLATNTTKPVSVKINGVVIAADPVQEQDFFAGYEPEGLINKSALYTSFLYKTGDASSFPLYFTGSTVDVSFGPQSYVMGNSWERKNRNSLMGRRQNVSYKPTVMFDSPNGRVNFQGHVYGDFVGAQGNLNFSDGFVSHEVSVGGRATAYLGRNFKTMGVNVLGGKAQVDGTVLYGIDVDDGKVILGQSAFVPQINAMGQAEIELNFDPALIGQALAKCGGRAASSYAGFDKKMERLIQNPDVNAVYAAFREQSNLCKATPFVPSIKAVDGLEEAYVKLYINVPRGKTYSLDFENFEGMASSYSVNPNFSGVSEVVVTGGGELNLVGQQPQHDLVIRVERGRAFLSDYLRQVNEGKAYSTQNNGLVNWDYRAGGSEY